MIQLQALNFVKGKSFYQIFPNNRQPVSQKITKLTVCKCSKKNEGEDNPRGSLSTGVSSSSRREVIGALFTGVAASSNLADIALAAQTMEYNSEESSSSRLASNIDTTVTDKVYLDFNLCPTVYRQDRTLGDSRMICTDGEPIGRVVIGLYGNQVPVTASVFKAMATGSAGSTYKGTVVHKIIPGQYFLAGKQGSVEKGEVETPKNLPRNTEVIESKAFLLGHNRPGTVSLSLGTNDDEVDRKLEEDYRNVEFLITTGPGPAFQLDSGNIVFGTVLEGMDVVTRIAGIPTYKPSDRLRQFNEFAELIGDERAQKGRNLWNKPLKSVVIQDCGLIS